MAAKRFDLACAKFRESNRLDPAIGTLFNLANCEEQRGQLATALTLYRQVLEKLPADDPRTSVARGQAQALDARVPRLTIRARGEVPVGTTVTIAGLVLGVASLNSPLPLNPGRYAISVAFPGRPTQEFSVTLAEGDTAEFPVFVGGSRATAVPLATRVAAVPPPARDPAPPDEDNRSNRELLAYSGIGVGAVGLTVGVIAGLVGLHDASIGKSNCNDVTRTCNQRGYDANQSAKSLATVSTVGLAVGVLAGGAGTYLWFTLPDAKAGAVGVSTTSEGTLLGWRGRW